MMCATCGCDSEESVKIRMPGEKRNSHSHDHSHSHVDHPHGKQVIDLETSVLMKNDLLAERNRGYFEAKELFTVNMVSSPGSGKTTLIENTIHAMQEDFKIAVIEGDQQTTLDADRIDKLGVKTVQINTGQGCHLDAEMVHQALHNLDLKNNGILFIENVGNLVCPALFDLGETKRVVIISVTEGEDKPLKYPGMFRSADVCLINKIDLLPYVDCDVEKVKEYALRINHHLEFFELSATQNKGMKPWIDWLKENHSVTVN